jgi:hypothetical protein
MGGVGDALDNRFDFAETVCLRNDRDVMQSGASALGVGRVDIGCSATIAQGIRLQLLVQEWLRCRCGSCWTTRFGRSSSCGGFLRCSSGCRRRGSF